MAGLSTQGAVNTTSISQRISLSPAHQKHGKDPFCPHGSTTARVRAISRRVNLFIALTNLDEAEIPPTLFNRKEPQYTKVLRVPIRRAFLWLRIQMLYNKGGEQNLADGLDPHLYAPLPNVKYDRWAHR